MILQYCKKEKRMLHTFTNLGSYILLFNISQEANKMKSAGIELMVTGVGDVIDMHFLSRLSDKSWPTFNPIIQREIESTLASGNNNNNNRNALDLCIILDNSQIVGEQNFRLVKSAMGNITNSLSMEHSVSFLNVSLQCEHSAIRNL